MHFANPKRPFLPFLQLLVPKDVVTVSSHSIARSSKIVMLKILSHICTFHNKYMLSNQERILLNRVGCQIRTFSVKRALSLCRVFHLPFLDLHVHDHCYRSIHCVLRYNRLYSYALVHSTICVSIYACYDQMVYSTIAILSRYLFYVCRLMPTEALCGVSFYS